MPARKRPERPGDPALAPDVVEALVAGRYADPFAVLGIHEDAQGVHVRTFIPGAERAEVVARNGRTIGTLVRRHAGGLFSGRIARRMRYVLRAHRGGDEWIVDDAYAYGPVLGPMDDWLIGEGTHANLYDRLGAHAVVHEGTRGVHFAVWAPNARRVAVVGDFNQWDGRRHVMRLRLGTGVWENLHPRHRRRDAVQVRDHRQRRRSAAAQIRPRRIRR